MKLNEVKYGFKLESIKELSDFKAKLYEFRHEKSGGLVAFVECDDTNCVGAFGFRTLPSDSTGVCHIIEHSLLCGSDKYPLKEPFVNLIKGSLATFLNAFTAYDWTMYPFASQTPKDFDNILKVYADACFAPLSMKDPKPFLQEGWHLELLNENDIPCYKGVVYNEMIGAMSDVYEQLTHTTKEAMYEGSTYAVNSGGDPAVIPELTYEQYKAFYKKHYTPQNCMAFFYGKMDIEPRLEFIDKEYYSKYNKGEEIIVPMPRPIINLDACREYEIGENEDVKSNTYMCLSYALDAHNFEQFQAMSILAASLLSNNDSPLKKALLDANLGQDVSFYIDDDNIVPAISIVLSKTNKEKKEEFKKVFEDTCRKLIKDGLDKETLLAYINRSEFDLKAMDFGSSPAGIFVYAMNMMASFNYHEPLESRFEYNKCFKKFKDELNKGYFEKLLEQVILKTKHCVESMVIPSKTLGAKKKAAMDEKMQKIAASLSPAEKKNLVKQTKELIAYQSKHDTQRELNTLPELKISDIKTKTNFLKIKNFKVNGMKGIHHLIDTNDIAYETFVFDARTLKIDELPYLSLLLRLYLNVDTRKYSVTRLNNEIRTYLGSFSAGIKLPGASIDDDSLYVSVSASALKENIPHISDIFNEVIFHSKFTKKAIKLELQQMIMEMKDEIISNGMRISRSYAEASYCVSNAINFYGLNGYPVYQKYQEMLKGLDIVSMKKILNGIIAKVFNKRNALLSIAGEDDVANASKDDIRKLSIPRKAYDKALKVDLLSKSRRALIIPSGVSYNAMSCDALNRTKLTPSGTLDVVQKILSSDYMWNEVRVKGGAYGASITIDKKTGLVTLGSYRDPNVTNTYNIYANIPEYLKGFKASKKELQSYIVGTMAKFDQPGSCSYQVNKSLARYLTNTTLKEIEKTKKELLHTKVDDVRAAAVLFEELNRSSSSYTVGNEAKINEYKFDLVEKL